MRSAAKRSFGFASFGFFGEFNDQVEDRGQGAQRTGDGEDHVDLTHGELGHGGDGLFCAGAQLEAAISDHEIEEGDEDVADDGQHLFAERRLAEDGIDHLHAEVRAHGVDADAGPVPRDYSKKQNRKERRLALKSAFAHKFLDGEVMVIEELVFGTPKTKEMTTLLKNMKLEDKKVLFVVDQFEENVILASRNLQNVALISSDEVNVLDIVNSDVMVMTEKALKDVEEVLK